MGVPIAPPSTSGPISGPVSSSATSSDFSSDDALLVEVQGENGAHYKARVRDVFADTDEVLLAFERDWQPQSKFPLSRVRLPPQQNLAGHQHHYTEGQEIEVYSRASDQVKYSFFNEMSHSLK